MARVARIRRYPIKGFDAETAAAATITDAGTIAGDRAYALCDASVRDGRESDPDDGSRSTPFNGKQLPRIHELRTVFDPVSNSLTVTPPDGDARTFALPDDRPDADAFFTDFFDRDVTLRRREPPAFVDRPGMGPSVISTATLREVASWFEDLSVEGVRRRLRANVEIEGVPAFWEDRFVGEDAPAFVADDVRFEGAEPCARCVVPTRDPDTGEPLERFRERFVERREATFPEWADRDAFEHLYTLMLIARVPEASRERTLRVGDAVDVVD